jgi:N-acetylneuraminate synthase
MNNYKKPFLIAEIGCNHMGDLVTAKELILLAKNNGANAAKFQKRNNKKLLTEEQYNAPHPNPQNSYGDTYGAHREFLEFSLNQHSELKNYCNSIDVEYSTSVWDTVSAEEIISLNPKMIKVPSACNNNLDLLELLRDKYDGEIHISLGMTTKEEEKRIFQILGNKEMKNRLVIYSCTSGYPVPFNQVCLLEILRLKDEYEDKVKSIAFSGHHLGISVDISAYTLGASVIERHFTKDRTWKGTDHAASLEPNGLHKLSRDLEAVHQSLKLKEKEILEIEVETRSKLKFKSK